MSEWKEVRFSDVIDLNPRVKLERGVIYPFIGIADINENNFYVNEVQTKKFTGQSGSKFHSGDTLFSRITPCLENRKIAQSILKSKDKGFGSTELLVFRSKEGKSDSNYVNYLAQTDIIVLPAINSMSGASGRQRADSNYIKKLKISVPDLNTQKKIANVLSTYDKLIENNNRRIEVLEQTAEEIYKEWFVRMRFPGYENTKLVKGIPEGWEVKKLNDIFDVSDGTHDTPKEVIDGFPLVTGRNIVNGQIDFSTTYNISEEDYKKINVRSVINKNDILYSNIGTIGQMALVQDNNRYSVKNLIILKTNAYQFHEYVYLHFKNDACQRYFNSVASGASQKFISLTEMRKYKLLVPKEEVLALFKLKISSLFIQVENLYKQNLNLIKQRDFLLPRLMNGSIEVK